MPLGKQIVSIDEARRTGATPAISVPAAGQSDRGA
jgi:hypothetical protein